MHDTSVLHPNSAICTASAGIVLAVAVMDEKEFKKHLQDLAHGHHHPKEHDWSSDANAQKTGQPIKTQTQKSAKSVVRKIKAREQ